MKKTQAPEKSQETDDRMKRMAQRDRDQMTIRELLLAIVEQRPLLAFMAEATRCPDTTIKTAITHYIGVESDPKGDPIRCPKNIDRFHGINSRTCEPYPCELCGKPGVPADFPDSFVRDFLKEFGEYSDVNEWTEKMVERARRLTQV